MLLYMAEDERHTVAEIARVLQMAADDVHGGLQNLDRLELMGSHWRLVNGRAWSFGRFGGTGRTKKILSEIFIEKPVKRLARRYYLTEAADAYLNPPECKVNLIKMKDLLKQMQCSRAHVYNQISDQGFPAPMHMGGRSAWWDVDEVDEWLMASKMSERKAA